MSSTPLTPAKRLGGLGRPRPSLQNLQVSSSREAVSPSPLLSPNQSRDMIARKTSYNQLTQNSLAAIPDASAGYGMRQASRAGGGGLGSGEVEVGDMANTPGGMYGTIKFIGNVKGKAGVFVGVELEGELAGRGKNDGAVDGVRYFTTAQPMSGIFVPLGRASKRNSTDSSNAPPTPTLGSPTGPSSLTPPTFTPTRNRSESPVNRNYNKTPGGRPSLPRPESPIRRGNTPGPRPSLLPPTTPRTLSAAGGRFGALSPTPGGSKLSFGARARAGSTSVQGSALTVAANDGRPGTAGGQPRLAQTPRTAFGQGLKQPKSTMGLRSGSSLGMRSGSSLGRHAEEPHDIMSPTDSIGLARSEEVGGADTAAALRRQLAEKDRQLEEQNQSLLEMEASLAELQSLVANASSPVSVMSPRMGSFEDADSGQLRALLREKNEKIHMLTAEFDAHRADFRSTIDTLELASTETERVYEKRVEDLLAEVRELQDRNEDVESVARQLKQLEELVQELEEGLEDARRGEAEARGEVEFLRGEVERSREELRREREKSAAAVANAAVGKMMRNGGGNDEVEKKDDEIRGLKAIIHSLSRDSVPADDDESNGVPPLLERSLSYPNGRNLDGGEALVKERLNSEKLQTAIRELEEQINSKASREEQLEREIEELKKRREARGSLSSEKTVTPWGGRSSGEKQERVGSWRSRSRGGGIAGRSGSNSSLKPPSIETTAPLSPVPGSNDSTDPELTPIESDAESSVPWCEICETAGHDILTCTNMFGSAAGGPASAGPKGLTTATAAAAEEEERKSESPTKPNGTPSPVLERMMEPPAPAPEMPAPAIPSPPIQLRLLAEKKKSVHLPAPPPMVDSGLGPMAGRDSGKVEMDKWCALCERDGHESVDCPLDTDF